MRHQVVRETLIIGCSFRQDSSWNFVELIQNLFHDARLGRRLANRE